MVRKSRKALEACTLLVAVLAPLPARSAEADVRAVTASVAADSYIKVSIDLAPAPPQGWQLLGSGTSLINIVLPGATINTAAQPQVAAAVSRAISVTIAKAASYAVVQLHLRSAATAAAAVEGSNIVVDIPLGAGPPASQGTSAAPLPR